MPSVILPNSRRVVRFRVSSVFIPTLFFLPLASFWSSLVVRTFCYHSLQDLGQLSKHYHYLFFVHVYNLLGRFSGNKGAFFCLKLRSQILRYTTALNSNQWRIVAAWWSLTYKLSNSASDWFQVWQTLRSVCGLVKTGTLWRQRRSNHIMIKQKR